MTRDADRRNLRDLVEGKHHRAEIVFAAVSFIAALLLASQIGNQTSWLPGKTFASQPAFWPVISIVGMLAFGTFELWYVVRRNRTERSGSIAAEVLDWVRSLEFVAWFLVYVALVPIVGYLPTTMAFCTSLAWRLGYRRPSALVAALLTGVVTVVVFKSLLSVRIPGGALYDYLPAALRNFMILYL